MVQLREEQARPQPQKMVVPGYSINHEGEVEQGVVTHRQQTRQRHLSSGMDEDIASSYFAAQYGGQQKQQQQQKPQQQQGRKGGSKQGSQAGSRRGSVGLTSNNGVQNVIASAAALIAEKKRKEQEARQEEAKRLLQRREMTPDNLRHVEEKLIQLQRQRQQEEEEERGEQPEEHLNQQQEQQQYQSQQCQQEQHHQQYQQQCHQQTEQQYQQQAEQHQQLPLERNLPPPPARTEAQRGSSSGRGESQSKEVSLPELTISFLPKPYEVIQSGETSYLSLLPTDGSQPYRTQSYGVVRVRAFCTLLKLAPCTTASSILHWAKYFCNTVYRTLLLMLWNSMLCFNI